VALGEFEGGAGGVIFGVGGKPFEQGGLKTLRPFQPRLGNGNLAGKSLLHASKLRPLPVSSPPGVPASD
jgi:hypothetical protein